MRIIRSQAWLRFSNPNVIHPLGTLGKCLYSLLCSGIDSLVRRWDYDPLKDYTFTRYTNVFSSLSYVSSCKWRELLVGILWCGLVWEALLQYSGLFDVLHIPPLRSKLLCCFFGCLLHRYRNASSSKAIYVSLPYKNRQSTKLIFNRHKNTTTITQTQRTILHGVWSVCNNMSLWFIPLPIVFFFTYYSLVLKALPIPKSICAYFYSGCDLLDVTWFCVFFKKVQVQTVHWCAPRILVPGGYGFLVSWGVLRLFAFYTQFSILAVSHTNCLRLNHLT